MRDSLQHDEFFVGYLPTPPKLRRMLTVTVIFIAFSGVTLAIALARGQRDPGGAVWKLNELSEVQGLLSVNPYPTLQSTDRDGTIFTALLVSEGKVGATSRLAEFDGKPVRLKGSWLHRNVRSMLELSSEADAIQSDSSFSAAQTSAAASNTMNTTLRGQIVDPKCYLGAMKPGEGKTHKACAVLCIRGGIPPMLVVGDSSSADAITDYLLVDSTGAGLTGDALDALLPFVGDFVEITGAVQQSGDLRMLRIGEIRRL